MNTTVIHATHVYSQLLKNLGAHTPVYKQDIPRTELFLAGGIFPGRLYLLILVEFSSTLAGHLQTVFNWLVQTRRF